MKLQFFYKIKLYNFLQEDFLSCVNFLRSDWLNTDFTTWDELNPADKHEDQLINTGVLNRSEFVVVLQILSDLLV